MWKWGSPYQGWRVMQAVVELPTQVSVLGYLHVRYSPSFSNLIMCYNLSCVHLRSSLLFTQDGKGQSEVCMYVSIFTYMPTCV